jgi:tetratricopeptide (TPR) repeat protein
MPLGKLLLTGIVASCLLLALDPKLQKAVEAKINDKKFDEAIAMLDAAHKQTPKDAGLVGALANAHLKFGDSYMYNDQLPPRQKYPNALREYRIVLEYDKTNAAARKNVAMIENIYNSMGRPIPK